MAARSKPAADQARVQRRFRHLTVRLFGSDDGAAWLELARRRWGVDLPRFRAPETTGESALAAHDLALVRDGRAEPLLEIAAYLDQFGAADPEPME